MTPVSGTASSGGDSPAPPSFWVVIPAGGAGTRLWPVSRVDRPKFLLPLLGAETLLQQTVARLLPLTAPERLLVVCGPAHAAPVARQLPRLPETSVVVEPVSKGTGPAIALAAAIIARTEPDAIMGSFAADHDVRDERALRRSVGVAIDAARAGWLVTIGVIPTNPDVGYGYIERTDRVVADGGGVRAYQAVRFVEKPDLARATEFLRAGRFLWHASMFVGRVSVFLEELARFEPDLHGRVTRMAAAWGSVRQDAVSAAEWLDLPAGTVEEQVLERAERVAVVPTEMGWSDVGEWPRLATAIGTDTNGNCIRRQGQAEVLDLGTKDSVVWSEVDRPIALINVENLIVVDTPHALLIAERSRLQDIRRAAKLLEERSNELPSPPG